MLHRSGGRPSRQVVLFLVYLLAIYGIGTASAGSSIEPLHSIRYQAIERQQTEWDCGPASVQTLLAIWGDSGQSPQNGSGNFPDQTRISLLDLKQFLADLGYQSSGYRLTWNHLLHYFGQNNPPLIVHWEQPQDHFTILAGLIGGHGLVADPLHGWMLLPGEIFRQRWSGHALHVALPAESGDSPRRDQHQLAWGRLKALRNARFSFPD